MNIGYSLIITLADKLSILFIFNISLMFKSSKTARSKVIIKSEEDNKWMMPRWSCRCKEAKQIQGKGGVKWKDEDGM